MKSSFKLQDGSTITVTAIHGVQTVLIEKIWPLGRGSQVISFFIPPDLAGVVAQAIELCADAVLKGPCGSKCAPLGRGMADAQTFASGFPELDEAKKEADARLRAFVPV